MNITLSIVSPVYMAQDTVNALVSRISAVMEVMAVEYEVILVEDGSTDLSWQEIAAVCAQDARVKGLRLSRNFGQHHAITAGLERAKGQWVVVMDCDLQDRPEEIPRLYAKAMEGYDIVLAARTHRKDSILTRTASALFYRTLAYLTDTVQDASVGNFGIYTQRVVKEITRMQESTRYFPFLVQWVGFRSCKLEVEHAARTSGTTTYSLSRKMRLALDVMLATSDKPLRLTVKLGFIIALIGLGMAAWTLVSWSLGLLSSNPLGYASIFFSLWLLAGCIMMTLGMVGLYVGKTFEGVKNRPIHIVSEET